ncbi:MAG: SCO family protein [Pseudomonadota bacterium]
MDRISAIAAGVVVALGLGAGGYLWVTNSAPGSCDGSGGRVAGEALIGGPFELTDHTGQRVTDEDIITEPSLVYFGYTFCPDVCPFDVSRNADAIDALALRGISATPVFVTIDPARDDVEQLSWYVEAMHPKMIGLTGTDEEIKAAADQYRAYYAKNGEGEYYLVDHSTLTYLMDDTGFVGFFRRNLSAEDIADQVACLTDL